MATDQENKDILAAISLPNSYVDGNQVTSARMSDIEKGITALAELSDYGQATDQDMLITSIVQFLGLRFGAGFGASDKIMPYFYWNAAQSYFELKSETLADHQSRIGISAVQEGQVATGSQISGGEYDGQYDANITVTDYSLPSLYRVRLDAFETDITISPPTYNDVPQGITEIIRTATNIRVIVPASGYINYEIKSVN